MCDAGCIPNDHDDRDVDVRRSALLFECTDKNLLIFSSRLAPPRSVATQKAMPRLEEGAGNSFCVCGATILRCKIKGVFLWTGQKKSPAGENKLLTKLETHANLHNGSGSSHP